MSAATTVTVGSDSRRPTARPERLGHTYLESAAVDIGALREDEVARAIDLADTLGASLYNLMRRRAA